MTTWIGTLAAMVPTACASALPVTSEDRWLRGGGAGTNAPTRHLMLTQHGPGARRWVVSRGAIRTHLAASLQSLVRAQERSAQPYRFVPCGAVESNMLTPGASEEFAGWLGTVSPANLGPLVDESGEQTWGMHVTAVGLIQSPATPLLGPGPWPVMGGLHVQAGAATVHLSAQSFNAAGASLSTVSLGTVATGGVGVVRAVRPTAFTSPSAVSWRLRATSSEPYTVARASMAQSDRVTPWRPGQAADAVILTGLSVDPIIDNPDVALSAVSYTAEETGV